MHNYIQANRKRLSVCIATLFGGNFHPLINSFASFFLTIYFSYYYNYNNKLGRLVYHQKYVSHLDFFGKCFISGAIYLDYLHSCVIDYSQFCNLMLVKNSVASRSLKGLSLILPLTTQLQKNIRVVARVPQVQYQRQ